MNASREQLQTIGRFAGKHGLEAKTLRYYDRVGLLRPVKRTGGGYRLYDRSANNRLQFILHAKALGISLSDIGRILAVRDEGAAPCRHVLDLLRENIVRVQTQIQALEVLRADLNRLQRELGRKIPPDARAAADCPCLDIIAAFKEK
jgi:DNA-binding transcriptional MerR regulator